MFFFCLPVLSRATNASDMLRKHNAMSKSCIEIKHFNNERGKYTLIELKYIIYGYWISFSLRFPKNANKLKSMQNVAVSR